MGDCFGEEYRYEPGDDKMIGDAMSKNGQILPKTKNQVHYEKMNSLGFYCLFKPGEFNET